ncbi:MAG: glycosyltransferase family 2 protein [Opitutaceae bacterium]|nr:glycosyltransferase family 2 protein [Opitutaceae bacterium]
MKPTVSIILCTRNRANHLRPTIESILAADTSSLGKWELWIVDNGSNDETRAIVEAFAAAHPAIHYLFEPNPGKCRAQNSALERTSGDIIVLTDDDVRVPRNWLPELIKPIVDGGADAVAGGVILPPAVAYAVHCSIARPYRGWFAASDYLDPVNPANMIGANMAFHRRVLESVTGFDCELGPGALGFFDEVLFSRQLMAANFRIAGALDTTVAHHFDLTRLEESTLYSTAHRMGRSHAYIFYHWDHQHMSYPRGRMMLLRLMLVGTHIARFLGILSLGSAGSERLRLYSRLGFVEEYLRQRSRKPNYPRRANGYPASTDPMQTDNEKCPNQALHSNS